MNETSGTIVRLEGDYAWVRAEEAGKACGGCAQRGSCSNFSLGSLLDGTAAQAGQGRLLRLPNTIHARPGDAVVIRAAEGMVLRAVWRAYGLPLLLGLAGAMAGKAWFGGEVAALLGMLAGLAGGFLLMRRKGLDSTSTEPILSIGFKRLP
jgi:positive regulator of sigma E activity